MASNFKRHPARSVLSATAIASCLLVIATRPGAPRLEAAAQTQQRSITATIVDRSDVPVANISAADLTVREDGLVREIIRVSPAPAPDAIAVLVDDSQAAMPLLRELRNALTTFANAIADFTPTPAIRLTTFGDRPTVRVDFIPSFPAVSRAVDRIVPRSGAGSTFLEALVDTGREMNKRDFTRPVIVAFVAETGPELSNVRHNHVADVLRQAGAALWTVTLTSPNVDELAGTNRERAIVLSEVTGRSGGRNRIVLTAQDIPRAFAELARSLGARYEITYGRPDRLIPPSRIEVRTRDASLRVFTSEWAAP